ncbi:MAG: hypothetical protein GF398_12730 [Chitinivibrionales bacterium]|nr:hypothetical protein [Chitinivibrionales bacterium]
MGSVQSEMIKKAIIKHKRIFPCKNKQHLHECFTRHKNKILFWFNTDDETTHVIVDVEKSSKPAPVRP